MAYMVPPSWRVTDPRSLSTGHGEVGSPHSFVGLQVPPSTQHGFVLPVNISESKGPTGRSRVGAKHAADSLANLWGRAQPGS